MRRTRPSTLGPVTRCLSLGTLLAASLAGCGDEVTGPAEVPAADLLVLNSTGQTLASYRVAGGLTPVGSPVDLGASFDGDGLHVAGQVAASTISSFGGSRVVFVDLSSGAVQTSRFPDPEADLANPSRPTFDPDGVLWVGGRASDAVYRVMPGEPVASRVAEDVGTFVERVVPVGDRLYAVDANIDDDGLTFQPLGPSRIVILPRDGGPRRVIPLPDAARNARDAVVAGARLVVLVSGTLDPQTFAPNGDGGIVTLDLPDGPVSTLQPLGANGLSLELGEDGLVYVTTTADFVETDVLIFDPGSGLFRRGPGNPLQPRDAAGSRVHCWVVTALADGRLLCATFSSAQPGRLLVLAADGHGLAETPGGFGTTDLQLR